MVQYTAFAALLSLTALHATETKLVLANVASTSKPRWLSRVLDPYEFTPNPDWWLSDTHIYCKAVAINREDLAYRRPATLIAPRVVVGCVHQAMSTGDEYTFIDASGNVIVREIVANIAHPSFSDHPWYYADLWLGLLDDVVSGIDPAMLLPENWSGYLLNDEDNPYDADNGIDSLTDWIDSQCAAWSVQPPTRLSMEPYTRI